jgi:plastocyanin
MKTTTKRTGFAALGVAAVLGLGACGGGGGDGEAKEQGRVTSDAAPSGTLRIEAHEFALEPKDLRAAPGTVAIEYVNAGAIPHTLVIDGVNGVKLDVASKGDVDTGTVTLEPGTYTMYCDIPGHRQAGMEAPLTVG